MPPQAKLILHRWDMHALQALAKGDASELIRVFTEIKDLPESAIDTQVKVFGFGAPMQFHTFGFFDKMSAASSSSSSTIFDQVVDGDTMLLIALRHQDAKCAIALINLGASRHVKNSIHETPIQLAFDAMCFLQLHPDEALQEKIDNASSGEGKLLKHRVEFELLFYVLQNELTAFYDKLKAYVETELREIYQRCAPDRVSKISSQLESHAYRETLLLASVKKKYLP